MTKQLRFLVLLAVLVLSAGAGSAFAAFGQPPLSDSTLAVSPTTINEGSGVALTFTFTVGSSPASITNGKVEVEAPDGWTFTAASIDTSSCNTSSASASFTASEAEVVGLSCATGQTLVLDVTATTPDVSVNTLYSFDGSFKTTAGGRTGSNVYRVASEPTITVQAV